ncbi:MAG: hypothetical protein AAB372_01550 [Patescibacteria group bacterium]
MKQEPFLIVIAVLILFWVFAIFSRGGVGSGPIATPPNPNAEFGVVHEDQSLFSNLFNLPPSPEPSPSPSETPTEQKPTVDEILKNSVYISLANVRTREPDEEYIDITYSSSDPAAPDSITLTGWSIGSVRGESYTLGRGTNLPGISATQDQDRIVLKKGATAHIITGRSPMGVNFKINKCSGYFNENYSFVPGINASCPPPAEEDNTEHLSDSCYNFVRTLYSCTLSIEIPLDLDNTCREHIRSVTGYSQCVSHHKNDMDFYQSDWWVYLNRPDEIWGNFRDVVTLKNERGIVIATQTYQ